MIKKCTSCSSCGMPFQKAEDHALGREDMPYCAYCTKEDGTLKTYEEVLEGFMEHLIHTQGLNKSAARQMASDTMSKLPAWNKRKK